MRKNKLISAISPLTPTLVTDITTGEILNQSTITHTITQLVEYCQKQATKLYEDNSQALLEEVKNYRKNPNAFGRKLGYKIDYSTLPRDIKAKSRINELVLYKLISETVAYTRNPNPKKQAHSFGKMINLGAIDKQMASLSIDIENKTIAFLFKCWDKELLLEFKIPEYVLKYDIKKWSLPTVRKTATGIDFIFSIEENIPTRSIGKHVAGIDLGRAEPFVLAITNEKGQRVAHYTSSPSLRRLNNKRSRLLVEKQSLAKKIVAYESLGLDTSILTYHKELVSAKTSRLGVTVAKQLGNEVATKLEHHWLNTVHVEDLLWVSGTSDGKIGSSRWNHSVQQEYVEHSSLRKGIRTKKVSPRNSSQLCHKCGNRVVHNKKKRSVHCVDCKMTMDRDYNAAMNIASLKHLRCPPSNRETGNDCSFVQIMESSMVPNSILGDTETVSFVT